MNSSDFKTRSISDTHIDSWITIGKEREEGLNVLLSGAHGTGKTTLILEGFKRHNMKFLYYSGSTLDPWTDVVGIPDVSTDGKTQLKYIDYVLPKAWLDNDIEAIFIDEYNRAPKKVKNALMELQQFKSINGRKFPKLKSIWAAVNPSTDDEDEDNLNYDVEPLDPAQLDRFHIIVNIPTKPSLKYFKGKYGNHIGQVAVDWWMAQNAKVKKILSPRRLDYACEIFKLGGNISEIIPFTANTTELVTELNTNPETRLLDSILANPTREKLQDFMFQCPDAIEKYRDKFLNTKHYEFYDMFPKDILSEFLLKDKQFQYYSIAKNVQEDQFYSDLFSEIEKATPSRRIVALSKIVKNRCDKEKLDPFEGVVETSSQSVPIETLAHNIKTLRYPTNTQHKQYSDISGFWMASATVSSTASFNKSIESVIKRELRIDQISSKMGNTSDRRRAAKIALDNFDNVTTNDIQFTKLYIYNCTTLLSMQKMTLQRETGVLVLTVLLMSLMLLKLKEGKEISPILKLVTEQSFPSFKYKLVPTSKVNARSKEANLLKMVEQLANDIISSNSGVSTKVSSDFISMVNSCNSALDVVL